jgi:Kdo2-lipid IVA lauroyltransferase/acyltransferase
MNRPPDSPAKGAAPQQSWGKRQRYRLEYAVIRSAIWFIPLLPGAIMRLAASIVGTLAWMCDGRGRNNGMENLRAAFGAQYSLKQRRRILQSSYRVFALTFLELFWSPRLRKRNWDRHFYLDTKDPAILAAIKANNCIYISPHTRGFELLGVAKALGKWGSMTIAQDFKNPPLTTLFRQLRSGGGLQPIIPQEGAMLRILKHLKKGGSAAALVDLTMKPEQGAAIIRTFGMLTSVSYFHCALAQRTGVPVILFYLMPIAGGRWAIRCFDPVFVSKDDDLHAVAQRCWDIFEPMIRERPQQWMWMYKHWRYLPENTPPESYPEYARRNPAFDALLSTQNAPSLKAGS